MNFNLLKYKPCPLFVIVPKVRDNKVIKEIRDISSEYYNDGVKYEEEGWTLVYNPKYKLYCNKIRIR